MNKDNDKQKAALIALLIAAFLLTDSDIAAMATLITTARLDSAKVSYAQASDTTGVDGSDWEPSDEVQQTIQDVSTQDAESIAATYEDDLTSVTTRFVDAWLIDHDTLDGCEDATRKELAEWVADRTTWKSEQIANYTCSSGANTGTDEWLDDLDEGGFGGLNPDDLEVTVLPEESSNDLCADYAGKVFGIDEVDTIPSFPIHSNCPHRIVIQLK